MPSLEWLVPDNVGLVTNAPNTPDARAAQNKICE